ncbi:hypothetical protein D3C87_2190900 [compost metagenome]
MGRQVERQFFRPVWLFLAARKMRHVVDPDAIFIRHDATDPDRRRHLIFRTADALADEIGWLAYAGI